MSVSYRPMRRLFEMFFTAFLNSRQYSCVATEGQSAATMESDHNNQTNCVTAPFCRLAWIARALDAARSHHAGKSEDELTAFGLINPLSDQQPIG